MQIENSFLVTTPIAHRGLHNNEFPENSIGAFENAIKHNYPFECDVQMLDDGTVVVFHDETLARMCGVDGYLKRFKKTDLKNFKLNKTNYSIPTLSEVLKLNNGQVPMIIEIKNFNLKTGNLEEKVYELIKKYKGEVVIQSFNPFSVNWFKNHAPEIIRGQLSSFFKGEKLAFYKKMALKRMIFNKTVVPHFIAYDINNLPNRYIKKYADLPLLAFVVDSEEKYFKAKKYCKNVIFEGFDIEKVK